MTINSLLQDIIVGDHTSGAKYPDGSGGKDQYTLIVFMDGHGKILNAKVKKAKIERGMLLISADGEKNPA
ncbi:hypothetical protein KQI82_12550 [Oscillibacter sp. MSJ-2]|uniref:Uncharacterized protein n=1 Tax=Dysosmobacter acutus TaxID=2841504 RepID=A0ABS6FCG6_9FIRM|nr:hypothetical protein [Dysosmobacter acutus]MBU5627740.1 hypothetical protein [Dysosmobacter acutus]